MTLLADFYRDSSKPPSETAIVRLRRKLSELDLKRKTGGQKLEKRWYISSLTTEQRWCKTCGWVYRDFTVFETPAEALNIIRKKNLVMAATIYPCMLVVK